jgi:hypothetical protein
LELAQNAVESGASRIWISIREDERNFSAAVRDNGPGMSRAQRNRALDPFRSGGKKHPGRRVGLGLALLRQTVEMTGGQGSIRTAPGRGTRVAFTLDRTHPDTPPTGDVPSLLVSTLALAAETRVAVLRRYRGRGYRVDSATLDEAVGGLHTAAGLSLARAYLAAREADVTGNGTG